MKMKRLRDLGVAMAVAGLVLSFERGWVASTFFGVELVDSSQRMYRGQPVRDSDVATIQGIQIVALALFVVGTGVAIMEQFRE